MKGPKKQLGIHQSRLELVMTGCAAWAMNSALQLSVPYNRPLL